MKNVLPLLIIVVLIAGCAQPADEVGPSTAPADAGFQPERIAVEHLPNAVRVHPKVISGGLPADDAAFAELEALGVKTVISVDGAKPDVAMAKKHGLRYVHLPFGYDGIPDERVKELAKAVRDLPGPIYIHCHHGKHRSPAGASVACVAAGLVPAEKAVSILILAGTSENYRGLYQSATEAVPLEQALLDELEVDFPAVADVPELAEAMVAMEHTFDHLKVIADADWRVPTEHPDLEPAHEGLLLREHFVELLRSDQVQEKPAEFRQFLEVGLDLARELETALEARRAESYLPPPPENLPLLLGRVDNDCRACHRQFRDVPLSEK